MSPRILVIEGITKQDEIFHPHDWPERLAELSSTFSMNHRVTYSALVTPSIEKCCGKGIHCLRIHSSLREMNEHAYNQIITFATDNNLKVHEE